MVKTCVAIDPSINNCGLAVYIEGELKAFELIKPERQFIDVSDYKLKARSIVSQIYKIYSLLKSQYTDTALVMEVPEHFGEGQRGQIARDTGSILKLAFVCGMIYSLTDNTVTYEPSKWKGQMSKEVVRTRLVSDYPDKPIASLDHNIVDAIGIGQKYIQGR